MSDWKLIDSETYHDIEYDADFRFTAERLDHADNPNHDDDPGDCTDARD